MLAGRFLCGILTCLLCGLVHSDMDDTKAMAMLKKYNYMGENNPDPVMRNDSMYSEALAMFQMVAGLNMTGELDQATMDKMESKRCGLPDIYSKGDMMKRKKRYVLTGSKWKDGRVGYNYVSYPNRGGLSRTVVQQVIDRAFQGWADVADLHFQKMDGQSDVEISFVAGDHGDNYPLDGPGGTLAHAFFPNPGPLGGDMHFDDEETWAVNGSPGTDLYYVALHELGHSLGLQHSMHRDAVMYPYYPGYKSDLRLSQDDITGMRELYGHRRPQTEAPTRAPSTTPTPRTTLPTTLPPLTNTFCSKGTVDAVATLDGVAYAFQGELYAKLDETGIAQGFPRYIVDDWRGVPSHLDAALGWEKHGILLLFKDDEYWRYSVGANGRPQLTPGYPRDIQDDFTSGLPDRVDAAFVWGKNGRVYLVRDGQYYRIRNNEHVSDGSLRAKCDRWYYKYPKDFSSVWGIDEPVSDAFLYHGRTFFFSDRGYYRYNDRKYRPDGGYPKSTAEAWFGCRSPGSLESPDMEMHMMEREPQLAEITGVLAGSGSGRAGVLSGHLLALTGLAGLVITRM